jgi:putative transposase
MSTKTETELIDSAGGARSEPEGLAQRPAGGARPPQGPPPVGLPNEVRDRLADEVIDELLGGARTEEEIVGPGGVLAQLTKRLVERAMSAELSEHLGYELHQEPPGGTGNTRNGSTPKTLATEHGPVRIETPRDRKGSFEPQITRKGQRRFEGFDDKILALYSRGLSTRDIEAHLAEIYGVQVGRDLISRVTDAVMDDVREWQQRPLDDVYPVVFLDALVLKIREGGSVQRRACYLALGVTVEGERDVLGMWFQETEGAKFWMQVLSELKQRGVSDILLCCVDGLKGFPEAIEAIYPNTVVQTCVVHLIGHSLKYVPRREREQVARDLKPIYTAVDADAAQAALEAFDDKWGSRFPVITQAWLNAWEYVTPFLAFPPELRRVVYTTDESVKSLVAAPVVESRWARVTPDRRAGRGDGSPAAQDCRLTASESHPSGGTGARSLAWFRVPVGDELAVRDLALLTESAFSGPHLLQVVGVRGAALAAA